jgi:hypothetical protein
MKKLLYILALTAVICTSVFSCTEEVVKPRSGGATGQAVKE